VHLDDDFLLAGQVDAGQLYALAKAGAIKSVLNMRKPTEGSFLAEEHELLESLGIPYYLEPVMPGEMTEERLDHIMSKLDEAPKPCLLHCASMMRAGAAAAAYVGTRRGMDAEAAEAYCIDRDAGRYTGSAALREVAKNYVSGKLKLQEALPEHYRVSDDLIIGPQVTKDCFRKLHEEVGVKSVINLRSVDAEAGSLGLGVLAREEAIVTGLGMEYRNIPTARGEKLSAEQVGSVSAAIAELPKPVFLHCRLFNRSVDYVKQAGLTAPEFAFNPHKHG
jgi:protein tyrosine phosphatase (PTP) superfamily phosphohydrolase (DUF442 family)